MAYPQFNEPSWLQNYIAEQKANAGTFSERYLKLLEQSAIAGISAYKSGEKSDKIKSIINDETSAAEFEGRPINYDKIYKLLLPIDKEEAAKYSDLAAEYNKTEINKTVATAFKQPREEYESTRQAIIDWDSTATTLKGLEAELETANAELTELETQLEAAKIKEGEVNSQLALKSSEQMKGYKPTDELQKNTTDEVKSNRYKETMTNQLSVPLQFYVIE